MKKLFLLLTVFVLTFSIGYSIVYYGTFNEAEQKELAEMLNKQKGNLEVHASWVCKTAEEYNDFELLCVAWAEINLYEIMDFHQIGDKYIIVMVRLYGHKGLDW